MRRLSVVDEIFLRTHRGLGTPIALQGLWRTTDPIDTGLATLLLQVHDTLRTGTLGRRVLRSNVPGARPYWWDTVRAYPLDRADNAISAAEILDWADRCGYGLDSEAGPGWRLAVAPVDTGGSVVALTCSHVLADARGLILAVDEALGGPEVEHETGVPGSDWADAFHQWSAIVHGTTAALRHTMSPTSARAAVDGLAARAATISPHRMRQRRAGPAESGYRPPEPADAVLSTPSVVLRYSADDWDRAAARCGATANSLFIWFVANTLWRSGFPQESIRASLPVDTRNDRRVANDMAMTEIAIGPDDSPASIRRKSREAYEHRISSPRGLPEQWLHVLPERIAYLMTRGAGERDILCSNIGALPATLQRLGSHPCTGVAARAIHPGLTFARRPRSRLSGYLCCTADDYTIALTSLDPIRISGPAELRAVVVRVAGEIGIPVDFW